MTEPEKPMFDPVKIMRIGSMIRQILEEMDDHPLDVDAVASLRNVYHATMDELEDTVPIDLISELDRLTAPFEDDTELTETELRIAHAQLLGWLEGSLQGLSLLLQAHQMHQTDLSPLRNPKNLPGKESGQYL